MRRHVALVVAVLVITAACGGGTDDPVPVATTPAPAVYTAAQLDAALPVKADLSAGMKLSFRCPDDGDEPEPLCPPDSETNAFSAGGDVDAASVVGAEQVVNPTNPRDFFAVNARQYPSDAAAQKAFDEARAGQAVYDGSYDIKKEGAVGVGTSADVAIGQWKGYSLARTATRSGSPKSDQGLLVTSIGVRSGTSVVYAFVSLSAAEREKEAATALAESLLRDYLERLG